MQNHPRPTDARRGFTLIELLTVIAIIAVLAALLTAGAQKVRITAYLTQAQTEIGQFATGIETFKTKFHLQGKWVPSKIRLREDPSGYLPASQNPSLQPYERVLEFQSYNWLALWRPQLTGPINWSGRNTFVADAVAGHFRWFDLEGDQALVFFLGGIPGSDTFGTGFSLNIHNPAAHMTNGVLAANVTPDKPIFEFTTKRMFNRGGLMGGWLGATQLPPSGQTFLPGDPNWRFNSYWDPLGSIDRPLPFIYFTATQRGNDYHNLPFAGGIFVTEKDPLTGLAAYVPSDCTTLATALAGAKFPPALGSLAPQTDNINPLRFKNPTSYQFMSASARGNYQQGPYGPGGT